MERGNIEAGEEDSVRYVHIANEDFNGTPVEVTLTDTENGIVGEVFPGGSSVRKKLDEVPCCLISGKIVELGGWHTLVKVRRASLLRVYRFLYGGRIREDGPSRTFWWL